MRTISFFTSSWAGKTDEELVSAVQQWDSGAFEVLYERWHKPLASYLWNILNYNREEMELVLSDVFIKSYEYFKTHPVENVKAMLYRVAHNQAIDRMRGNGAAYEAGFDEVQLESSVDPHDEYHRDQLNSEFTSQILQDLLGNLDPQMREVVYLYYQEEKSYDEIAELIGSNKNSIGTLLFSAKKKLQILAKQRGLQDIFTSL